MINTVRPSYLLDLPAIQNLYDDVSRGSIGDLPPEVNIVMTKPSGPRENCGIYCSVNTRMLKIIHNIGIPKICVCVAVVSYEIGLVIL